MTRGAAKQQAAHSWASNLLLRISLVWGIATFLAVRSFSNSERSDIRWEQDQLPHTDFAFTTPVDVNSLVLTLLTPTMGSGPEGKRGDRLPLFPQVINHNYLRLQSQVFLVNANTVEAPGRVYTIDGTVQTNRNRIRKSRQLRHFQRLAEHYCQSCTANVTSGRQWAMFLDDDALPCPNIHELELVVAWGERHFQHVAGIRTGIGSNGVLLSCTRMCQFSSYLQGKNTAETPQTDIADIAIDVVMDKFLLSRQQQYGERYFVYRNNLFSHNAQLRSTMQSGHAGTPWDYGHCYQRPFWLGRHHQVLDSCRNYLFSPCHVPGVFVPPVQGEEECQSGWTSAALESFQVVLGNKEESCNDACSRSNTNLVCNAKLIELVNRGDVIESVVAPEALHPVGLEGSNTTEERRMMEYCAPMVYFDAEFKAFVAALRYSGCANLDQFCERKPANKEQRICPCSGR